MVYFSIRILINQAIVKADMDIETLNIPDYEIVKHAVDKSSGLDAIIAVHSTKLGPALGGLRLKKYESFDSQLTDAKRLAEAMTYKCAIAGLDFGGCKCVINADPKTKTPALLESMADFISSFNGMIYTGKDLNITLDDLDIINSKCKYLIGTKGKSGDPSPMTALGVYHGIDASLKFAWKYKWLNDMTVLVQGLGAVGYPLASMLYKDAKKLLVTDTDNKKVKEFTSHHKEAEEVNHDIFSYYKEFDIFVPCATGNVIRELTVEQLAARHCKIIAGSANNQLNNENICYYLAFHDILYAPDFVINAGGLMSVASELLNESKPQLETKVKGIGQKLLDIYAHSTNNNPPNIIAKRIAEERLGLNKVA